MKLITLVLTLVFTTPSFANFSLGFGKIRNVWAYSGEWLQDMGEYRITRVKATTTAKASGGKLFGKWKNCYASRYENVPRSPFNPKYVYTSKKAHQALEVEVLDENIVSLGDVSKNHQSVSLSLKKQTKNKCKVTVVTRLVVEFYLVETDSHLKYQFFIEEKGKNLVIENLKFNGQGNLDKETFLLKEGEIVGPIEMATYSYNGSF